MWRSKAWFSARLCDLGPGPQFLHLQEVGRWPGRSDLRSGQRAGPELGRFGFILGSHSSACSGTTVLWVWVTLSVKGTVLVPPQCAAAGPSKRSSGHPRHSRAPRESQLTLGRLGFVPAPRPDTRAPSPLFADRRWRLCRPSRGWVELTSRPPVHGRSQSRARPAAPDF